MKRILSYVIPALLVASFALASGPVPPPTIPVFTTTRKGAVPAPGSVGGKFLGDDATWHSAPTPAVVFGSGGDGVCNFSGGTVLGLSPTSFVYQLDRNIYCSSMTVGAAYTVDPNSWAIHVSGTLQLDGKIAYIAGVGGDGLSDGTPGGGASGRSGNWLFGSTAGAQGGATSASGNNAGPVTNQARPCATSAAVSPGSGPGACQGGPGAVSDTGSTSNGQGGATTLLADSHGSSLMDLHSAEFMRALDGTAFSPGTGGGGGPGGTSGGCGPGGGGGASGGPVVVFAMEILGSGTIEARGGDGGAAGPGPCLSCTTPVSGSCSGGGGGGGGGGFVVEVIGTGSFPGSSVAGGAGGGSGPGNSHQGTAGGSGVLIQIKTGV